MNLTEEMIADNQITMLRNVTTAERAVIEAVDRNAHHGLITITYYVKDRHYTNHRYTVTLVTNQRTRIKDQFGKTMPARHLTPGMVVNAQFSSEMTRSQPPQANAYSISVLRQSQDSRMEEGRILEVTDRRNSQLILTGRHGNPQSQMRYVINNDTLLRNQWGEPIPLSAFHAGQRVRIERSAAQTRSIPPQTNALSVQLI